MKALWLIILLIGASTICADTTPPAECNKNVVLMGYWPPTNEMLRQFSTNPAQNTQAWQGQNWQNLGYDVYAFFPEFPPDGDPTNDAIGSPGSVGADGTDLQVDFQDTSEDFWRIVDTYDPLLLITTSRGGRIGWEIEAVEGGHGVGRAADSDPALDWTSDRYGQQTHPTQDSIDPRSWMAIEKYRRGNSLPSQLPMQAIASATKSLNLVSVEIDENGTSGNYLSGFLGLHGLYYNTVTENNLTAGHIHVGARVKKVDAIKLMETTLRTVLLAFPASKSGCSVQN